MAVKRISPREAHQLMEEGYVYLDVRSTPEFAAGHPTGARNVPVAHMGGGGMAPNPDFTRVVEANFARDARLILGCKSGGRSQRAAMMLEAAGFTSLLEMRGGMSGEGDAMGRLVEAGWASAGLPVSTVAEPGATWPELSAKAK
jgi:rhodanese-related sulfurtransferase